MIRYSYRGQSLRSGDADAMACFVGDCSRTVRGRGAGYGTSPSSGSLGIHLHLHGPHHILGKDLIGDNEDNEDLDSDGNFYLYFTYTGRGPGQAKPGPSRG